jgi:hypothetical protein
MRYFALLAGVAMIAALPAWNGQAETLLSNPAEHSASTSNAGSAADAVLFEGAAGPAAGFVRGTEAQRPDPCFTHETVASPTRPNWDSSAMTTPCGNLETDFGWLLQPMGGGVRQTQLVSSVRFGLTPRLDVRWGVTNHIAQSGGETGPLQGIGDQTVSAIYRFHEQGRVSPAMAVSYGVNLPMANPTKGFGSGFVDHQFVLIASRDVGAIHLDMNAVGTLTGEAGGHDGAVQFGLAATRPVTRRLAWIVESFGGPQPGTADRFGAALTGGSYTLRSWLALDGAMTWTYTAGSPRKQVLFGLTWARRAGFVPSGSGSRIGRMLGR